ncbi:Verru_Chthon cassette protein D [Verrucomicrobiales bacterium]|nr:Verru_Chthon cassette protein D [Verrucomicrobiales bacterium]
MPLKLSTTRIWKEPENPHSFAPLRGFSLIEIMVVLSLVAIMLALAGPGFIPVMQARSLTSAADELEQALSEARQVAMTEDLVIEIEFLGYQREENRGLEFAAYRFWKLMPNGERREYGPIHKLESSFVFLNQLSTLLRDGAAETETGTIPNQISGSVSMVRFAFFPNGETNLPEREDEDNWHITIGFTKDNLTSIPNNFIVFQINQTNSHVTRLQP